MFFTVVIDNDNEFGVNFRMPDREDEYAIYYYRILNHPSIQQFMAGDIWLWKLMPGIQVLSTEIFSALDDAPKAEKYQIQVSTRRVTDRREFINALFIEVNKVFLEKHPNSVAMVERQVRIHT